MKNNRAFITIFLLVATELIGFGLIIPILPQISHQFTSSGMLLGILLSSYSFAQFIAAPILGKLSDRFGRKPILVLSKIGTLASYILLAYSNSFALLLLSRSLDGFTGGNIAVARAYLSDISDEKNRSKSMAIIGIAFGVGFIIGPAIGSICYAIANNFSIAGWVGAGCSLISLIITQCFLKEPEKKESTKSPNKLSILKQRKLISASAINLFALYGIVMVVFSGFETTFSVYTNAKFSLNESQNSLLFLGIGLVAFVIQGSFTKIAFTSIKKASIIALICMASGLILSNLFSSLALSLSVLMLLLFGFAIINTHVPAAVSKLSTEHQGFLMGCYESVGSIARIIGPLIIYSILFNYINVMYTILGTFLLTSLIIFSVTIKDHAFKFNT